MPAKSEPDKDPLAKYRLASAQKGKNEDNPEKRLAAAKTFDALTAEQCRKLALEHFNEKAPANAALGDFLAHWATLDGGGAMDWALKHTKATEAMLADLGHVWTAQNAEAVFTYLTSLAQDPESLSKLSKAQVPVWFASTNPLLGFRIAGLFPSQREMGHDLHVLTQQALSHRPDSVPELLEGLSRLPLSGLPNSDFLQDPLHQLRLAWVKTDFPGWQRWRAAHPELAKMALHEKYSQDDDLTDSLSCAPVEKRGEVADRWLQEASSAERAAFLTKLTETWAREDINAAGTWLGTQAPGPELWAATEVFAKAAVDSDPEAAFIWSKLITDPKRRETCESQVFLRWHRQNPTEAQTWLAASSVPEAQRIALQERLAAQPKAKDWKH